MNYSYSAYSAHKYRNKSNNQNNSSKNLSKSIIEDTKNTTRPSTTILTNKKTVPGLNFKSMNSSMIMNKSTSVLINITIL